MNMTLNMMPANSLIPRVVVLRMVNKTWVNYSYLVIDPESRQAVAVDPAWEIDKVQRALADAQATLSGILVTHAHHDHIDLAGPLALMHQCPVWMSQEEIAESGFNAPGLVGVDSTPWSIGGMRIEPILTPGHTPGCMCYRIGDNLFTGDVLFAEGCGLCFDLPSAYEMYDSLARLKDRIRPWVRIFPGHSYGREPGRLFSKIMKENIYLQFKTKESLAAFRLRARQGGFREV